MRSIFSVYFLILSLTICNAQSPVGSLSCILDSSWNDTTFSSKIPCGSLYNLNSIQNPVNEYLKHLPDSFTPIKTVNLRIVLFHRDSAKDGNFNANNIEHVGFFDTIADVYNNIYSSLSDDGIRQDAFTSIPTAAHLTHLADSTLESMSYWEPGDYASLGIYQYNSNGTKRYPQVSNRIPAGSPLSVTTDSKIRFRIHDIVEIVDSAIWALSYPCDGAIHNAFVAYAQANNIPNDAINLYFTGSENNYKYIKGDTSVNKLEMAGFACVPRSWSATTNYSAYGAQGQGDVYYKYWALKNGYYCNNHPDSLCCNPITGLPEPCPMSWYYNDDARGWLHETGHTFLLGHSHQFPFNIQGGFFGSTRRRTLYDAQLGQIHRLLKNSNLRNAVNECTDQNIERPITGNVTFNENQRIYTSLRIKSGATLTVTCELHMPNNARIVVEPGGKLIVDGGKITNINNSLCGNGFWYGIEVLGTPGENQSFVSGHFGYAEFKNEAIIEKAIYGVRNYNRGKTGVEPTGEYGGIIRATNTTFKDNLVSVVMEKYYNYIPQINRIGRDLSYFKNCTFLQTDAIDSSSNVGRSMVRLDSVFGIQFLGDSFINTSSTFSLHGISAMDAGFTVAPSKVSGNEHRPYFENMHYGVSLVNTGVELSFSVNKADFLNVNNGIHFNGVDGAVIKNSNIELGVTNPENTHKRGIWALNASGFEITENSISLNPENSQYSTVRHGIWISNAGIEDNRLYKNTIKEVDRAVPTMGVNRGVVNMPSGNDFTGLQVQCNDFDNNDYDILSLDLASGSPFPSGFFGMNQEQFRYSAPDEYSAGNEFTPSGFNTSNFFVNTSHQIKYWKHSGGGDPLNKSSLVIYANNSANGTQTFTRDCPMLFPQDTSSGGGGTTTDPVISYDRVSLNNQYHDADTSFANLYYTYNQLIDGGSTPALLTQIQEEWTDDMWELRNELLAKSPLSEDALLSAAYSGVLSDALLLEVCLANPQATDNEEVLDILQYEIPNTLNQYAIEAIINSWDQETYIGSLRAQLSALSFERTMANNAIVQTFLFDTAGINLDSVHYYEERTGSLHSKYNKVLRLARQGLISDAEALMTSISASLPDNEYLAVQYNRIDAWVDQVNTWKTNGKNLSTLDSSDISTLETFGQYNDRIGGIANGILHYYFGYPVVEETFEISEGGARIGSFSKKSFQEQIRLYPNPAKDHLSVELIGFIGQNKRIQIYNMAGQLQESMELDRYKSVVTLKTHNFKQGQYILKCTDDKGKHAESKFSIVK